MKNPLHHLLDRNFGREHLIIHSLICASLLVIALMVIILFTEQKVLRAADVKIKNQIECILVLRLLIGSST